MEIKIKKVHTLPDIAASAAVFAAGVGLFFVLPGWGILFCLIGILLFVFWKRASRRVGERTLLKEMETDVAPECREALLGFLGGTSEVPEIRKADEGDYLWLDVFYNKGVPVAYAQLYDVTGNDFTPDTGIVELRGERAESLLNALK